MPSLKLSMGFFRISNLVMTWYEHHMVFSEMAISVEILMNKHDKLPSLQTNPKYFSNSTMAIASAPLVTSPKIIE